MMEILGSFIQRTAFARVTRLLKQKDFPIDRIVSHQLPLARIGEALQHMRDGRALKVLLDPAGQRKVTTATAAVSKSTR